MCNAKQQKSLCLSNAPNTLEMSMLLLGVLHKHKYIINTQLSIANLVAWGGLIPMNNLLISQRRKSSN